MNEKEWTAIMKKLARINPKQFPDHVRDLKHLNEKIKAAPEAPQIMDEIMDEIITEEEEEFEELTEEEVNCTAKLRNPLTSGPILQIKVI